MKESETVHALGKSNSPRIKFVNFPCPQKKIALREQGHSTK